MTSEAALHAWLYWYHHAVVAVDGAGARDSWEAWVVAERATVAAQAAQMWLEHQGRLESTAALLAQVVRAFPKGVRKDALLRCWRMWMKGTDLHTLLELGAAEGLYVVSNGCVRHT